VPEPAKKSRIIESESLAIFSMNDINEEGLG
jgi:hypothetical protein